MTKRIMETVPVQGKCLKCGGDWSFLNGTSKRPYATITISGAGFDADAMGDRIWKNGVATYKCPCGATLATMKGVPEIV